MKLKSLVLSAILLIADACLADGWIIVSKTEVPVEAKLDAGTSYFENMYVCTGQSQWTKNMAFVSTAGWQTPSTLEIGTDETFVKVHLTSRITAASISKKIPAQGEKWFLTTWKFIYDEKPLTDQVIETATPARTSSQPEE